MPLSEWTAETIGRMSGQTTVGAGIRKDSIRTYWKGHPEPVQAWTTGSMKTVYRSCEPAQRISMRFGPLIRRKKLGHHEHLPPHKRLLMRTLCLTSWSRSTENGGSRKPPYWKQIPWYTGATCPWYPAGKCARILPILQPVSGPFVGPNPRMALETRLATISLQAYWLTAFGAGGADVNSGILVIVVTKINGSMLNWPICSKFAQCRCKFLNRFQKLATRCGHCKYRKNSSAMGCYTRAIFRATSYHCKSALQIDQCNTPP